MKITESEQILYVDIDNTLVRDCKTEDGVNIRIDVLDPYSSNTLVKSKMLKNIKIVRDRKARGAYIIAHSANGYKWVVEVIKALNLEHIVDEAKSKPVGFLDDLESAEWMGSRIWFAE